AELRKKKPPKDSPTRIYTQTWDASRMSLTQSIEDIEIFKQLFILYTDFDLINFNMIRGDFTMGANFAIDKLPELETALAELRKLIDC
ncbi:hypothetical protein MUP95_08885, partial [bacterium]|nr:hypothetical protein [bacterium]